MIPCSCAAFERLRDLFRDRHGFQNRNSAVREAICERRAFDQFHHQRDCSGRLSSAWMCAMFG
jgi:hypothetical protein